MRKFELHKLGEIVSKRSNVNRRWKIIEHVRKNSPAGLEAISEPPHPRMPFRAALPAQPACYILSRSSCCISL